MRTHILRLFTLCIILAASAFAHPHVFVNSSAVFNFDDEGLSRIDVIWTFDEMFSATLREDYDENGNGKLDAREKRLIIKDGQDLGYMCFLSVNGEERSFETIDDFEISDKGKEIFYTLSFTTRVPAEGEDVEIVFASYDPEYFVAFTPDTEEPYRFNGIDETRYTYETVINADSWEMPPEYIIFRFNTGGLHETNVFADEEKRAKRATNESEVKGDKTNRATTTNGRSGGTTKRPRKGSGFSWNTFMRTITGWQRMLKDKVSNLLYQVKTNASRSALFLILAFSFLYGVIHALGPGHGKLIVTSYFASREGTFREGALAGFIIAFLHGLSAIVIVGIITFVVKQTFSESRNMTNIIRGVSSLFIVGVGSWLLIEGIKEEREKRKGDAHEVNVKRKNLIPLAVSIGLVPCEGAMIILSFANITDAFVVGLVSVFAMSLGMAITIMGIAFLTIAGKRTTLKVLPSQGKAIAVAALVFRFGGTVAVITLGILLFISSFTAPAI